MVKRPYCYYGIPWDLYYRCFCGRIFDERIINRLYLAFDACFGTWLEK